MERIGGRVFFLLTHPLMDDPISPILAFRGITVLYYILLPKESIKASPFIPIYREFLNPFLSSK